MPAYTSTRAVSPGYIYTVTASSEAIVRDTETDKLLCKANNGSQGMFVAIGGTVSLTSEDITATITQSSTTSGGARFEVQPTRPATGEEGVIYLIPITSGTEEENEYEEWIWVKGEWERLGTTGVNLSNYATLTDANTYSGDNTFNGLLLKKTSASLGDTSVLNRSEADARYGRLGANNIWDGSQEIKGTLHLHQTLYVDNIQPNYNNGVRIASTLLVDGDLAMHPTGELSVDTITSVGGNPLYIDSDLKIGQDYSLHARIITANHIHTVTQGTGLLYTDGIESNQYRYIKVNSDLVIHANAALSVDTITSGGGGISIISDLWLSDGRDVHASSIYAEDRVSTRDLYTRKIVAADSATRKIEFSEVRELQFLGANGGVISGVTALKSAGAELILLNGENNTVLKNGTVNLTLDHNSRRIIAGDARTPLEAQAILGIQTLTSDAINVEFHTDLNPAVISINSPTVLEVTQLSRVRSLKNDQVDIRYDDPTVSFSNEAMLVEASEGIKVTSSLLQYPEINLRPYKVAAMPLDTSFGQNKWGLILTPDSCQFAGIHFASNSSGSIAIGSSATPSWEYSVAVGKDAMTRYAGVAIGAYANAADGGIGIGYDASAANDATALGYGTIANNGGVAIGRSCSSDYGTLNLSVGGMGNGARCSMLFYGGSNYAARDNTGYLKFEIGDTLYNDRYDSGAQNDTITISKPNLWSALDRAKYRGAQPYASYAASAVNTIPALEPNSITHVYTATDAAIDLSDITLAQHDTAITTAELWIEVTTAGATITWPDDMLWPDEADPTTAPSFPGPEASTEAGYTAQRLYCVTLRTQPVINVATGNADTPVLIATIAYTLDHKVSSVGS